MKLGERSGFTVGILDVKNFLDNASAIVYTINSVSYEY